MLCNGIVRLLGLEEGKDWVKVRRELTDEEISRIYLLYEALWPLETDLLKLLPKPDGSIHSSRRVATKAAPASVCISSISSLPTVWVVGPISTANPARGRESSSYFAARGAAGADRTGSPSRKRLKGRGGS
jgi:hypothetical protein